jgi:hypothetical protein
VALQSGTTNIPFPGYDFTPSGTGYETDWFGPGPVSAPQEITGQTDRFYTISPDSELSELLYRHVSDGSYGPFGAYLDWYTTAEVYGVTIHQWALENSKGQELSQDAANALFGTGPLVTDSANPVVYKDGGAYFDFDVPANGIVSRFDVFTQWGKDNPGFAPKSLQPADTIDHGNMHVGLDPKNDYSPNFDNSYVTTYTLKYDSNNVTGTQRPSKLPPVSGSGPRRGKRT